jgi:IclR family transcriptional regulator, KDG regulon repressor
MVATTLHRGLDLLTALAGSEAAEGHGLGVTRLAELTGEDKSQVSRSLSALAAAGFVERDPDTRRYRLGWHLFALAARAGEPRLLAAAGPVLAELVIDLGETAHLSVLHGVDVLTVRSSSPPRALQAASWVGQLVPAYASSAGRALLLDADRAELGERFARMALRRLGPNTVRDVDELAERTRVARSAGYAVVDEELEPGLVGVAAPVRGFTGLIVAALNISAPRFRLEARLDVAGKTIAAAAARLSRSLGYASAA